MGTPILAAEGICKSFGPVQVLFDITLALERGEVHALVGEKAQRGGEHGRVDSVHPGAGQFVMDDNR